MSTIESRRSFIHVDPESHFPIQNLPYGVFIPAEGGDPRVGVAIGDQVLDLAILEEEGLLETEVYRQRDIFNRASLNAFMKLGRPIWRDVRYRLQHLLDSEVAVLRDNSELRKRAFHSMDEVTLRVPVEIGDYTDFYSSIHHAHNVGTMIRGPENALMPNYKHLPVAYHGRASSVILSGQDIHRPLGQTKPKDSDTPVFGPCKLLDFELEMGFFVGTENPLGVPVSVDEAEDRIFGFVLVNDWSARDVQTWEYVPLGPFNAKNFATSISPWVVTMEALEAFRVPGPEQDPEPLPYLRGSKHRTFDIRIDVELQSEAMQEAQTICSSNYRHLYWTPSQQLAHHTITGCNLRPGDLLASGTISGPEKQQRGSMLELSWRGSEPIELDSGETRTFLQDGDRVTMRGWCEGKGYRVGFGEVSAKVLPAIRKEDA